MTFKKWINQFIDSSNIDGDLARDIEKDAHFPNSNDYNELYSYLKKRGADQAVVNLFMEAWNEYTKDNKGVSI